MSISAEALAAQAGRFYCGGQVEQQVWDLWNEDMSGFLEQRLLRDRLLRDGDVYALYDFQIYTHNMVSMARRCNRTTRLSEVAQLIRIAYDALEPGSSSSPGRRWICRGGSTCNDKNRLLNTEVALDSVQFLALASSVANALASSRARLDDEDKAFISDTIRVATEHLERWADDAAVKRLRKAAEATPQDVKDGSSALFFTDQDLWLITVYAELAGLLRLPDRTGRRMAESGNDGNGGQTRMREHLRALLRLFSARTSYQRDSNRLKKAALADLDRGYWRLYKDNRYAGYEKEQKPVACPSSKNGQSGSKMEIRVPEDSVPTPQDTGWDISHARRLVPALDALDRNRKAMKSVFSLDDIELPPKRLPKAFAGTLVAAVWNGDKARPLFSNYWSGANGWFRVAYDNGTGQCREGYPPYGMSDAFLTGGYITWAPYWPVIGMLGRRMYELIDSRESGDAQFIGRYYPNLSPSASAQSRARSRFMFLPSLVGGRAGGATSNK